MIRLVCYLKTTYLLIVVSSLLSPDLYFCLYPSKEKKNLIPKFQIKQSKPSQKTLLHKLAAILIHSALVIGQCGVAEL